MKILFYLLFILSFYSCQNKERPGLLWEISGNGLEQPSYLFGTWHGDTELRNSSFLDSVPGFHQAFAGSQQFIWEGGYRPHDISNIILPKDTTYEKLLSRSEIVVLDSILNINMNGVSSSQMNLRPMQLGLIIALLQTDIRVKQKIKKKVKQLETEKPLIADSLFLVKRAQLYAEKDVMDVQLCNKAKEAHAPVVGLDSIIQFDVLKTFSKAKNLAEEAKELMKALTSDADSTHNSQMQILLPLRKAYRAQDIVEVGKHKELQISSLETEGITKEETGKFMQAILIDRNKKWMKHLPALMQGKSSFIAVGAVHLPYEYGLINLLRKEGYTVKPVVE